ncbi:ArsR/SmtB family transcription factor [Parasedimentitalea psychrophila]|uniref:Metalloregulator ArsR/SmtB family transcription factor n=1 Tax=Parasedimentitalea psychrophila TaxID=2997337 RepID=A0A9Y2KYT8_9RHOB|nr:metalloregulator ArsR/SmtB family transcription factor [Parasedimentitalea psychrophila]NRB17858.1 helix-turn-helix transcriptional regulator [Paracoccaceae bacterium]WIY23674.1 metalloregulator ArsR/SmtB family transcription factor [Parasedimentitalea psychrophila]
MNKPLPDIVPSLRALANPQRAQIMDWLLDPTVHFPPQRDGDLVQDGVCVGAITDKTTLTQPTVTSHMKMLDAAGLVTSKKIKNWVFYKADLDALDHISQVFGQAAIRSSSAT